MECEIKGLTETVSIIKNVSSFRPHYEFISYFCVDIPFFDVQEDNLLLKQSED